MLARALSLVVAGALALGAVPAHASAAPDANEIERLYGKRRMQMEPEDRQWLDVARANL